jgi:hypothetical protein
MPGRGEWLLYRWRGGRKLSIGTWLTSRRTVIVLGCLTLLTVGAYVIYLRVFSRIAANEIAVRIGTYYGDRRPRVVSIESDLAERTDEPMYTIRMTGNFHTGTTSFHCIAIGALADRWDVFYVGGSPDSAACRSSFPGPYPLQLDWNVFNH